MKAKVLMSFHAYNIIAQTGEEIEISDPNVFLDLAQAGFVDQVDRVSVSKPRKKVEKE